VRAVLYVETQSQKQIVIGRGGQVVKAIGAGVRPELELILGHRVFVDLRVKVRPKWRRDEALLERLRI
jgi:GTPase